MEEREILDQFHYHEALDRTDMINNIIDENLISHWVFQEPDNQDLKEKIEAAQALLGEVYQEIGNRKDKLFGT